MTKNYLTNLINHEIIDLSFGITQKITLTTQEPTHGNFKNTY